jgi:hypothetical protein
VKILRTFGLCLALASTIWSSALAQQHNYLHLGRDPQIRGGVTVEQARQRGWQPHQLSNDVSLTMYGAKGESVSGWLPAGTWVAWLPDGRERILACGNLTNRVRISQKETVTKVEYRDRDRIVTEIKEVPVEVEKIVERERIVKVPVYQTITIIPPYAPQYVANLPSPTVNALVVNGIPGIYFSQGSRVNVSLKNSATGGNGYGAAAAAAAASSSTSSTAATPTSAAGTSGGSSGSSGAGADGSHSGSR